MTDAQLTEALAARPDIVSPNAVISTFHCGYQQAQRCLGATSPPLADDRLLVILAAVAGLVCAIRDELL